MTTHELPADPCDFGASGDAGSIGLGVSEKLARFTAPSVGHNVVGTVSGDAAPCADFVAPTPHMADDELAVFAPLLRGGPRIWLRRQHSSRSVSQQPSGVRCRIRSGVAAQSGSAPRHKPCERGRPGLVGTRQHWPDEKVGQADKRSLPAQLATLFKHALVETLGLQPHIRRWALQGGLYSSCRFEGTKRCNNCGA